ncbi:Surfeit locus 2 [Corchorus olitorius]|uniref:Surfeit locus 2 n=1 Tax=Corchorus olitorius TaxID=93759 RepID=A0A1R3HZX3_9ROSI|nr:Surfeit locus 2 [Corchorus olitorius]
MEEEAEPFGLGSDREENKFRGSRDFHRKRAERRGRPCCPLALARRISTDSTGPQLNCKLTGDSLKKTDYHIWKHMNGKCTRKLKELGNETRAEGGEQRPAIMVLVWFIFETPVSFIGLGSDGLDVVEKIERILERGRCVEDSREEEADMGWIAGEKTIRIDGRPTTPFLRQLPAPLKSALNLLLFLFGLILKTVKASYH